MTQKLYYGDRAFSKKQNKKTCGIESPPLPNIISCFEVAWDPVKLSGSNIVAPWGDLC